MPALPQPYLLFVGDETDRGFAKTALGLVPDVTEVIELTLLLGRRTNPAIRCPTLSFNTAPLGDADAEALMVREEARLGLPFADPMRGGARLERLVDACLLPE